jgi:hypothetical protein
MMVNTKEIDIATTVIPLIPVPAQIINIGANAVLGNALKITNIGSRILANRLFHHKHIAIIIPNKVPIIKPRIVSTTDMRICLKISPVLIYSNNNFKILEGLLNKNESIIFNHDNNSHKKIITVNKII